MVPCGCGCQRANVSTVIRFIFINVITVLTFEHKIIIILNYKFQDFGVIIIIYNKLIAKCMFRRRKETSQGSETKNSYGNVRATCVIGL